MINPTHVFCFFSSKFRTQNSEPRTTFLILIINLFLVFSASAQNKELELDSIFAKINDETPGAAAAVSLNGKLILNKAYGSADIERAVPLTVNSVFDIGSVRKTFIAASVLLLAEDGTISLGDDIRKYFPELPDYGVTVTIDHLLTHTGGIRDWTALEPLAGGNPELLPLIYRQKGLNFTPGSEWSYSNSGYILLAELVARVSGIPFGEFASKRIFQPLGIKNSSYGEDPLDVVKNRAVGYEMQNGSWKLSMLLGNERGKGSGAIFSTAADLVTWSDALMNGTLSKFVTQKMSEPAVLNSGRKLTYGRGLMINESASGKLLSHSGDAAGYSAWIGGFKDHNLSVAVVCNFNPVSATAHARKTAELFLPEDALQKKDDIPSAGIPLPDSVLDKRTGIYLRDDTGEPFFISSKNGSLLLLRGVRLTSLSPNRFKNDDGNLFFMSQDEFEINFTSDKKFELTTMEGEKITYTKAGPLKLSPTELNVYKGKYISTEGNGTVIVEPAENGLKVFLEHEPERPLMMHPIAEDLFQFKFLTVRFTRAPSGNITGIQYTSPLLNNISYQKQ